MKTHTRILLALSPAIALCLLLVAISASSSQPNPTWSIPGLLGGPSEQRGRADAKADLSHGRFRELGFGLPAPWLPLYASILKERYGVEFEGVAGCMVTQETVNYVRGYNAVSAEAILRRFGRDVLTEAEQEASRRYAQSAKAGAGRPAVM